MLDEINIARGEEEAAGTFVPWLRCSRCICGSRETFGANFEMKIDVVGVGIRIGEKLAPNTAGGHQRFFQEFFIAIITYTRLWRTETTTQITSS